MQHFKHYPFKYNGRKIIGARWYIKGYEAEFGKLNTSDGVEYLSPRDASGHGTHIIYRSRCTRRKYKL